jgi:hypothetical protein
MASTEPNIRDPTLPGGGPRNGDPRDDEEKGNGGAHLEPKEASNGGPSRDGGEVGERRTWFSRLGGSKKNNRIDGLPSHNRPADHASISSDTEEEAQQKRPSKWTMGQLNDPFTDEVPGTILLLPSASTYNEPLGLRNAPARTSASSLPSPYPPSISSSTRRRFLIPEKKRTKDGKFVLEPQPDDSLNDPLNWKAWRRDLALLSLGLYCMLGGGMTTVLAAGFKQVSAEFNVPEPSVALTTGLYMMGLGLGSVVLSPTAILFGKRPVYLVAATCFILTALWCALSPSFGSLVVARIFMGFAVSSVECLPSATVAEIFFLHEKAYRLGIYTMLLLGGKNLVPLVSAVIIQAKGWRWAFYVVAMVVGFGLCLLFFFVPETFWDRAPRPHQRHSHSRRTSHQTHRTQSWSLMSPLGRKRSVVEHDGVFGDEEKGQGGKRLAERRAEKRHAHFAADEDDEKKAAHDPEPTVADEKKEADGTNDSILPTENPSNEPALPAAAAHLPTTSSADHDYFTAHPALEAAASNTSAPSAKDKSKTTRPAETPTVPLNADTTHYLTSPPKTYLQTLLPYSGRLSHDNWFRVMLRPFVLFAYPSILWSTLVYSLSVGWLIVISESVATIYENKATYNFNALQTGLVYISPFIGGVLGTAVAWQSPSPSSRPWD